MNNKIQLQISRFFKVNKFLKVAVFCLMAFAPITCSDYLDVRPDSKILLEEFWQKGSDVEATVLACYRAMQEDNFMWRVIAWGEVRSDNVIIASGDVDKGLRDACNANILPTNSLSEWGDFYRVINYCNTVLKYAPDVLDRDPNFTTADLQAKSAEALAIRALCYFYLVRTFRDVPLSLDATVNDNQNLLIPQSTPAEVLAKITEDLLQAEQWALSEYSSPNETRGRMTKDAIRAILADVYLWQKKYAECINYCDMLINATEKASATSTLVLPKYQFMEVSKRGAITPMSDIFFWGNSSESIFELQFNTEKYNEGVGKIYGKATGEGREGQLRVTTLYVEGELVFSKTDERKGSFIYLLGSESGAYRIWKYVGFGWALGSATLYDSPKTTTPNWIFYRISDIMLMKAEALVQLNRSTTDLNDALYLVNKTYMRSNTTLLEADSLAFEKYGDQNTLDYLVLLERQRELMFEGKRWFDLVRRSERKNSPEDLVNFVLYKYTDNLSTIAAKLGVMNALYLPVNEGELIANPQLVQNPYYITTTNIEK